MKLRIISIVISLIKCTTMQGMEGGSTYRILARLREHQRIAGFARESEAERLAREAANLHGAAAQQWEQMGDIESEIMEHIESQTEADLRAAMQRQAIEETRCCGFPRLQVPLNIKRWCRKIHNHIVCYPSSNTDTESPVESTPPSFSERNEDA